MRFAVVTEGTSDFLVLRAVLQTLIPGSEVEPLHPEVPVGAYPEYAAVKGQARLGAGWRGVLAWCREYGEDLELLMRADRGRPYDALVIHVDAAMADKVDCECPCPPADATAAKLRERIVKDWLGRAERPAFVVLATPSKSTDAWAVAAVAPGTPDIECDPAVRNVLVARGLLPRRSGGIRQRYTALAQLIAADLVVVRRVCTQAERFALDVEACGAR